MVRQERQGHEKRPTAQTQTDFLDADPALIDEKAGEDAAGQDHANECGPENIAPKRNAAQ